MDELLIEETPDLQKMFDMRRAEGLYVDAAEYIRDLVRRDMVAHAAPAGGRVLVKGGACCK
jgi:hypothetical protein